jgi:hypothetical protein
MSNSPDATANKDGAAKLTRRQRLRAGIGGSLDRVFGEGISDAPPEDAGYLEAIPLDQAVTDTGNPRWENRKAPTWEQILNPESVTDQELKDDIEYIYGLAYSMEPPVGQTTPGDVYRQDGRYIIISGECRYWALRLREHWTQQPQMFKVIVRPDPPAHVVLLQYLENFKRRSPQLRQQLPNLQKVVQMCERLGKPITDPKSLAKRVGASPVTGYRWWAVLSGPEDVRTAILDGKCTSIQHAYGAAQEEDEAKRTAMLNSPPARASAESEVAPPAPAAAASRTRAKKRGRPQTYLALGRTRSHALSQYLILTLDPNGDHADLDWRDFKAVHDYWTRLMKRLEQQMKGKTVGAADGR